MKEETLFKKVREWINTHTRLTITEVDPITINVKETCGTDSKVSIDLNITKRKGAGKYSCVGYISYLSKYEPSKVDLIEVCKTVNSEEGITKILSLVILKTNDLTDTIYRIESELNDR